MSTSFLIKYYAKRSVFEGRARVNTRGLCPNEEKKQNTRDNS